MESVYPSSVSVAEPVSKAIEKTKAILFQPFDLKKWYVIGFCVWLSILGEGGGGSGGGRISGGSNNSHNGPEWVEAKVWLASNLYWLAPVAVAAVLLIIVVCILLLWLRSRGKFMFLHCVALNRAEIAVPWRTYADQGNSIFLFKLAVGAVSLLCILPLIGLLVFSIWLIAEADITAGGIALIVLSGLLTTCVLIISGIISKFTNDFVIPIMALRYCRALTAWREFIELLRINKRKFVLYLLFQILIMLVIGAITSFVTLTTCCFCCTFLIPFAGTYIAAVIFLPLSTFARSYSLFYLAQYGTAYDVFAAAAAVPVQAPQEFTNGNGI